MTDSTTTPGPDHSAGKPGFWDDVFSLSKAKKAYNAGTAAAGVALAGGLATIFSDGKVEGAEVSIAAGAVIVAFVGVFVTTYTTNNAA